MRVPIKAGQRVKCASCGGDIHIDHFAGVVGTKDGPAFICDKSACLNWAAGVVKIAPAEGGGS